MKYFSALMVLVAATCSHALAIRGTVKDSESKPVQDANVWVVQQPDVWRTATDASGTFKVEGPSVGSVNIIAFKEGLALGGLDAPVIGDGEVNITLGVTDALRLRTINHEFAPIAGVRMRAFVVSDVFHVPAEFLLSHGFQSIRSGNDGEMAIECLPKGSWVRFTLGHPAYAEQNVPYFPVGKPTQQIPMKPGVSLAGRVTGEGKPLANARVGVFRPTPAGPSTVTEFWSDPEGYFSGVLRPDEYYVAATHRMFATNIPQPVVLTRDDTKVSIALALETARVVSGAIVFEDGSPAVGIEVGYLVNGIVLESSLSDAKGRYRIKVGSGEGRLIASPPDGFALLSPEGIALKDVSAKESDVKAMALLRIPVVHGKIIDEAGKPAAKAAIVSYETTPPLLAVADAQGEFEIKLQKLPQSQTAGFFAESADRFERTTFNIEFKSATSLEVRLGRYEPAAFYENKAGTRNDLSVLAGKPAPPITCARWRNTEPVTLEGLKGKVVALLLWGGFAMDNAGAASVREFNLLYELYKDANDIAILGVHDAASTESDFDQYVKRFEIQFPVGQDVDTSDTFDLYDTTFIPQAILIDRKGVLRFFDTDGRLLELIKVLRREAP
jgi:hypothetical protein